MAQTPAPKKSKNPSEKLTTKHRLHASWEYRKFFDRSEVFRLRECVIFRIPNEKGHFRLGITLKARGRSVDRNRVKRQVRESFRTLAAVLGAHDYNVVIPATKKMIFPYPNKLGECLRTEFKNALNRR